MRDKLTQLTAPQTSIKNTFIPIIRIGECDIYAFVVEQKRDKRMKHVHSLIFPTLSVASEKNNRIKVYYISY